MEKLKETFGQPNTYQGLPGVPDGKETAMLARPFPGQERAPGGGNGNPL